MEGIAEISLYRIMQSQSGASFSGQILIALTLTRWLGNARALRSALVQPCDLAAIIAPRASKQGPLSKSNG